MNICGCRRIAIFIGFQCRDAVVNCAGADARWVTVRKRAVDVEAEMLPLEHE